ncbi:MAG: monooxygenase [Nitriliruptorales bacterium]|nr:monooxygenase [Nitriliruptorales bacterium]
MRRGRMPDVLVMGGSLGGLTAALLLRDIGCRVTVHERSRAALDSRGAGIVSHELTVRYLVEGGVMDVDEVSTPARWLRYLDLEGRVVHEVGCRYRFTSWNSLHKALLAQFPPERYVLGSEVTGFRQGPDRVLVEFAGGGVEPCDLLVCADGISSTARSLLLPGAEPAYAGYVGWRGTVAESELHPGTRGAVGEAIIYHVGERSHILTYPIPNHDGGVSPGRRLINFVWYRNVPEGEALDDLLTDVEGQRRPLSVPPGLVRPPFLAELRRAAQRLPAPMAEVVLKSPDPFIQAIFDVEVSQMAFGRICLVGDAAFAARPHAAAGTAKAAADGWALRDAMVGAGDVGRTLALWEPGQLELGRRLVERARRMGRRSQFEGTWDPVDPTLAFGLYGPGH